MEIDPQITPPTEGPAAVEMPRPTAAPLVLAVGIALLAAGVPLGSGFLVVGILAIVAGLSIWLAQFRRGRGHVHEPVVAPALGVAPLTVAPGGVEHLRQGMPGYRLRLPQDVHPISAGIKGGIIGGMAMPVPTLLWSILSGHGLWYPVNLLAGMVLPGVGGMDSVQLGQFHAVLLLSRSRYTHYILGGDRTDLWRAAADVALGTPTDRLGRTADADRVDGRELREHAVGQSGVRLGR